MRYLIKHELPGRIRFDLQGKIPEHDAVALEELLLCIPGVTKTVAYPKAGSLTVTYGVSAESQANPTRQAILGYLDDLTLDQVKSWEAKDSLALAPRPRHLFHELATMTVLHYAKRFFLPAPILFVLRLKNALPFWKEALKSLAHGRLDVAVLDGAAILMGFLSGSSAAGSSMFLLNVGGVLEDYTQRRSESSLVQSLLDIPANARLVKNGEEVEVPITALSEGDIVVARLGDAIPVDGEVVDGQAAVNQSSLTGESVAIERKKGDSVYAGTAVEAGEVFVRVTGDPQDSKIRSIVTTVEQAESMKSSDQKRVESMADSLVPWNFLLAGIVALTTRNLTKTTAALMVDYSCALKLSGSIAVMSAQRESAQRGFTVKGSRYFDHMAEADTIVFDKTGTLTQAAPAVCGIRTYDGYDETEVLRLSACLEEHFPHPVARAVVNKAKELGIEHRERHADVEYLVAHGIASSLDGKRCVIGSEHFVIEDEKVEVSNEELEAIHEQACGNSPLFLAVDGILRGVIFVKDPLKPGVAQVIQDLKNEGFEHVIMLTGDNANTARLIADEAGITEFVAEMLPEDKHAYVKKLQAEGHKVCMVGDGVNDSPALSAAHVSVAMSGGSAVAREAADITLVSTDLNTLVELRQISSILMKRMNAGYTFAVAFNSALMALGISGIITPQLSSALHNGSTVALSAWEARGFLPKKAEE